MKKAVADAKVEVLVANELGVMFDSGRVRFRPLPEHKNSLKIFAINDSNQTR